MAKIVISGYYGFDNLGDEAILAGIIDTFNSLDTEVVPEELKITVLSNQPEITVTRYGVEAVHRNNLKEIIRVISNCDLFVSGGGSLLQDITGWRSIPYYLGLVFLAQLMGKKTVFYAQGVGPVQRNLNKKMIKWVGNRTELITVRDSDSRSFLLELGIKPELITETVDPVFGLEPEQQPEKSLASIQPAEVPLVGVAVRPWKNNEYLEAVACGLDFLTEKYGGQILIIPMHFECDREVSKSLKKMLDSRRKKRTEISGVRIWEEVCQPEEMLNIFSELDFLLGVRLHSIIFAAVNRIPFVGISYDPKVDSFLQSLDLNAGIGIEECGSQLLKNKIENVWLNREWFVARLEAKTNLWRQKARMNAKRVLNLL